uniref:Sulfatase domain-containing protein n=1 Tax=Angiostrongylus cantonensis TaxID=6313 RepID=A0A0K0DI06_ANGCA
MIAQDYGVGIAYYPNCLGFRRSEADHIWRPFDILRGEGTTFKKSFKDSCSEPHLEMLDYLEKFMNSYTGTPKFAQVWPTYLAHDTLKHLYHADEHFLRFFKKNRAIVDKSFFFFMGDHGPRFEGIREVSLGQYENLNPFLMVMIPSMYRNTSIHHQLYQKTNQLMTNFDLHATIMDILKVRTGNFKITD